MKHTSLDNIYNEIMLLSDYDKKKLYNRMKNEFFQNSVGLEDLLGKQVANKRLLEIMKTTSAEAKRNGFKPEMLEEILSDCDE